MIESTFELPNLYKLLGKFLTLFMLALQLVMQYLYYGGTETLHIRNTDIMEVFMFYMCFKMQKVETLSVIYVIRNRNPKILKFFFFFFLASVCS